MDKTTAERPKHAASARKPRRKRDPDGTREAILEAARAVLAQDGKEGLSVSQVAHRARVNRSTAYQHFQTREQLLEATASWVSDKLYDAVFGDPATGGDQPVERVDLEAVTEHLADFAMENPELGRIWLFEVLSSQRPGDDPFFRQFKSNLERFAKTDFAQPGMDPEVIGVLMLAGSFLWPVWARAHTRDAEERRQMAKRFSLELLRYSLHGSLRPEKYPKLDKRLKKEIGPRDAD
jgi:AcrR family transcriptional regulator